MIILFVIILYIGFQIYTSWTIKLPFWFDWDIFQLLYYVLFCNSGMYKMQHWKIIISDSGKKYFWWAKESLCKHLPLELSPQFTDLLATIMQTVNSKPRHQSGLWNNGLLFPWLSRMQTDPAALPIRSFSIDDGHIGITPQQATTYKQLTGWGLGSLITSNMS